MQDLSRQLEVAVSRMADLEARVSHLGAAVVAGKARELRLEAAGMEEVEGGIQEERLRVGPRVGESGSWEELLRSGGGARGGQGWRRGRRGC